MTFKKRICAFFCLLVFGILFCSVAFADYPDYLNGDRNYILAGGHMGYGWYLDKGSLAVESYNPPNYIITVDVVTVEDANKGNTAIYSRKTMRYGYDWNNRKMYSFWNNQWHYIPPVGSLAETGHQFSGEMAFYIAYNMKFYGGKKWLNHNNGRYESPNFSDDIYLLVDGSK